MNPEHFSPDFQVLFLLNVGFEFRHNAGYCDKKKVTFIKILKP
jgi:hypothetical protein